MFPPNFCPVFVCSSHLLIRFYVGKVKLTNFYGLCECPYFFILKNLFFFSLVSQHLEKNGDHPVEKVKLIIIKMILHHFQSKSLTMEVH